MEEELRTNGKPRTRFKKDGLGWLALFAAIGGAGGAGSIVAAIGLILAIPSRVTAAEQDLKELRSRHEADMRQISTVLDTKLELLTRIEERLISVQKSFDEHRAAEASRRFTSP